VRNISLREDGMAASGVQIANTINITIILLASYINVKNADIKLLLLQGQCSTDPECL
jgi:hypothetical protein